MVDARIGRLLIASLHQGILEAAPARIEFYEHWLSPTGLREGRMAVAALNAALSFLRGEGGATYQRVMTRAGIAAAEWTFLSVSPLRRGVTSRLPTAWRARAAMRVARSLVYETFHDTRLKTGRWRRKGGVRVRDSVFCVTRATSPDPLCTYYAAAMQRLFLLYRVDADVAVEACKAAGAGECMLTVRINGTRAYDVEVEAA